MTYKQLEMHSISFFKKMFKANGGVSSKRVVGFSAFILVVAAWAVALFGGPLVPEYYYFGVILLITGCFALNSAVSAKYAKIVGNDTGSQEPEKIKSNDADDRG